MRRTIFAAPLAALLSVGCGGGEQVALNERLFAASTMTSEGGGCALYELGGGGQASAGAGVLGFSVVQTQAGDHVVVDVSEGNRTVVQRSYDEAFFKSGQVDEFVAASSTAGNDLLLRYWGKFHPNGLADCAPTSDDGAR